MTRSNRVLASVTVVLGLGIGGSTSAQDATHGQKLFLNDGCYLCHGTVGQGGRLNGFAPRVARTALPADAFIALLREPPNDMPPYVESVLSDKDAADIYAYVSSLPEPTPAKDIAILNH